MTAKQKEKVLKEMKFWQGIQGLNASYTSKTGHDYVLCDTRTLSSIVKKREMKQQMIEWLEEEGVEI